MVEWSLTNVFSHIKTDDLLIENTQHEAPGKRRT